MQPSIRSAPRWLLAFVAGVLLISIIPVSLPGRANAQDDSTGTPTATETPTETTTVTAADTTPETNTGSFAVGDTVVVADGPLNARSEAGTESGVEFQLETGDTVTIKDGPEYADDYAWYEITTVDDETAWVASAFLGPIETPDFAVGDVVAVVGGTLNVRDDSSIDADVITQLETGDTATVLDGPVSADSYTWFEVKIDDSTSGWVAGEFLTAASNDSGDTNTEYSEGDVIQVVDGPLNVREAANTDATLVLQLDEGDTATIVSGPVTADGYDWYEIEVDADTSGWIASDFVALADDSSGSAEFKAGDGVRVAVDGINFRTEPGVDSEVLDTLDINALMLVQDGPVEADGYSWYKVFNYFYGDGWVAGELVTLDPNGFPAAGE